jgi:hypothetical protein
VFFYENTGPATSGTIPNFTLSGQTNVFGFNDIDLPNEDLRCDWVITRIVDFFGDGCPEAIAYNPCHNNSPTGDIFYYKQFCDPVGIDLNEPLDHFQAWYVEHTIYVSVSSNEMASATATLFDISGKQIYHEKHLFLPGLNEFQLAARNLPTGIYLLKIHNGNRLMIEKVLVR